MGQMSFVARMGYDMDVGDIVILKEVMSRHIVTSKDLGLLGLVSVKSGEWSSGFESDFYFFKVGTLQEFITAYEASKCCREVLASLPIAAEAFKVYGHRGDDAPSIFMR